MHLEPKFYPLVLGIFPVLHIRLDLRSSFRYEAKLQKEFAVRSSDFAHSKIKIGMLFVGSISRFRQDTQMKTANTSSPGSMIPKIIEREYYLEVKLHLNALFMLPEGYKSLGLIHFFTTGNAKFTSCPLLICSTGADEVKCWTIRNGFELC